MKRVVLIVILMCVSFVLRAQYDNFYYANGVAQYWEDDVSSANIIVRNLNHYDTLVYGLNIIFNNVDDEIIADDEDANIIVNSSSWSTKDKYDVVGNISVSPDDIAFFSYSKVVNGSHIWLTNEVYVKLKDSLYYFTHIQPVTSQYQDVSTYYEGEDEYRIVCNTEEQVVSIANQLYDTNYVLYSTPDFYSEVNLCTNDEYYDEQWNLKNIGDDGGVAGVDIKAEEAWSFLNKVIGEPGSNVKVAVIDDGVEEHEDLYLAGGVNKVLEGYTANGNGTGRPVKNGFHGQMCAGVIAAVHNDIGVAGVASNARIVPIRIYKNMYINEYKGIKKERLFRKAKIAEAIKKSWDDFDTPILNCSWRFLTANDKITDAIKYVTETGRSGKGCFVVCSSGNDQMNVQYPANLDCVMAVGAIDRDGEKNSYSNYGNKLDIVAPTNVPTIDRMGDLGWSNNETLDPNYISAFSGTSAACPHVAGVAALMLSVNPDLTRLQITDIIKRTAQKVGGYNYQIQNNDPQMTWCPETGYGLIDAHMAVVESMLYGTNPTLNGNREMYLCDSYTFSCDIINPDAFSYEWTYSDNLVALPSNDNTINVKPIRPGSAWVKVNVYSENRLIRTLEINDIAVDNSSYNDGLVPLSHSLLNFTHNTTLSEDNHYLVLDAVVEEDVTLTITGTVYCSDIASIKIKPGGKLIVDGGELTSVCSDKQWQGIEVWGVDSLNQNIINGQCQQGFLVLKNGATIENAICAVNLCNPADEHGSGGVVQATDAVFLNNAKSIRAADYSNYNHNPNVETANVSFFRQCSFTVDEDYIGDETFHSHVELSNVDGIRFYACTFSVDNDVPQVSSSSSAITAYNAGFSVESLCDIFLYPCPESSKIPSSFDGFNKAVSVTNSGGVSRIFSISGSSFNNNEIGIYAENTGYATIIMNDFMVGTKGACNYGIYLDHVTNFCIEENTFSRDNYVMTLNKIYGIAVKNSASFNDIYLNHFSNLYCGVVAIGSNKIPGHPNYDLGLTYTCNTNYGNTNDIGVLRDGIYGNIDGEQGSNSVGAGNTFSASNYHFYHNGINHSKVKYYYHGSGNKIPTRRYNVTIESAISDNDCLSHYSAIPPGPGGELMSVITTDSLGSMYTLTRVTGNLVRNSLNEEERDYDELREWLGKANDMNSDRMIVASYIQQGDFDNASSYAKTLVKKYALQGAELDEHLDYMEIISLHESLHETQRSVKQLTDYEKAMLEDMAENGVGGSQLMARSILDESRGTPTIIISSCPTIPTYGASVRGESEEITEPTSDKDLKVEVSPNPATSSVEISYVLPEKEKTATFVLTNTLGVNVLTTELEGNNGVATINLDNIPSGIYFYTVRSGDDVMTGKLVVE